MLQSRFVLMLFCLAMLLGACNRTDLEHVEAITSEKDIPLETSRDVEIIYSDSGYVQTRLTAPVMLRFTGERPYLEMPQGLHGEFFTRTLEKQSDISADYGIRYPNEHLTIVRNNVVVINSDGDTLTTEELTWEENKDRIFSEKFVRVASEDEVILSQGFESNLNFTDIRFYQIKGILRVQQD